MVEIGMGIPLFELLDDKLSRGGKGNMVAVTSLYPRVEDAKHVALAIKY